MSDDSKLHDLKNKSRPHGGGRKGQGGGTQIDPNAGAKQSQQAQAPGQQQSQTASTADQTEANTASQDNQSAAQESTSKTSPELEKVQHDSLQTELEDWKNKSLRLAADLQNLTRQHELDLAGARKSAKRQTIMSLLTFLNTLNLAFAFAPQTDDEAVRKFIDTLKLSFEQVIGELKGQQIEILIPHIGQPFDPDWMNLLSPAPDAAEHPAVKQIVGLGLRVDSQLVQPASVLV